MVLSSEFLSGVNFFLYKKKHLFIYIIYGLIATILELLLRNFFISIEFNILFSNGFSLIFGIFVMFWLNAKYNFSIPKHLLKKSFLYFATISLLSFLVQNILEVTHKSVFINIQNFFLFNIDDYNIFKIIILIIIYLAGYFLHLKISFKNTKKVGVAIYAHGIENIKSIFNKINYYPDFIHVDIIDQTMNLKAPKSALYKFEIISAYWPNSIIETHIMSKNPSQWISKVSKFSNIIYFHYSNNIDVSEIKKEIIKNGSVPGIAFHYTDNFDIVLKHIKDFEHVLILTINTPGISGQKFQNESLKLIAKINKLNLRKKIKLCIDGGINSSNVANINSDSIVSGKSVLNDKVPKKMIMRLKTNSIYDTK